MRICVPMRAVSWKDGLECLKGVAGPFVCFGCRELSTVVSEVRIGTGTPRGLEYMGVHINHRTWGPLYGSVPSTVKPLYMSGPLSQALHALDVTRQVGRQSDADAKVGVVPEVGGSGLRMGIVRCEQMGSARLDSKLEGVSSRPVWRTKFRWPAQTQV